MHEGQGTQIISSIVSNTNHFHRAGKTEQTQRHAKKPLKIDQHREHKKGFPDLWQVHLTPTQEGDDS